MSNNSREIAEKVINYLIMCKAEELENKEGLESKNMPRMEQA